MGDGEGHGEGAHRRGDGEGRRRPAPRPTTLELDDERLHGREAVGWVAGERAPEETAQAPRQLVPASASHQGQVNPRQMAVQRVVQGHGKAELVAASVHLPATPDLRCHVGWRADDGSLASDVVALGRRTVSGQPEVGDDDATILAHEHVVGLEVAMSETSIVRRSEPAPRRRKNREELVERGSGGEPLTKRRPDDELHGDEHAVVVGADIEDRHDVGVRELGERPRLSHQTLLPFPSPVRPQHLQGDAPVELGIVGLVDDPHASDAGAALDLVATERVPR